MAKKGRSKGEKPEAIISALQAANEDLRSKLTDIQIELHQEKCKVDEIKAKDRTIFSLEKELESATGFLQKLQLQKDALDEQLFLAKEAECNLGSPKREVPGRAGADGAEHCGSPDMRRNQRRLAELNATIRKLEDRNTLLVDERNELLKRVRESERQCKPLLEKNKLLNKRNEELTQSLQRQEEKLKALTKENAEMKEKMSSHPPLKKLRSLNDLDQAQDEQEIEFLKLQVLEQQNMIDDLTRRHIVVDTFFGYDEESMDSETSSVASFRMDRTPATPDEDLDEGLAAEESELRFRQLTREYQALQRAYALLQEQKGGILDAEIESKAHEKLQADVLRYKAKIEDLENELNQKGQDSKWVEEKQSFLRRNQELLEKVEKLEVDMRRLQQELQDSRDQNELLEFRILELEERERRSPPFNLQIHPFTEGVSALQIYCMKEGVKVGQIGEVKRRRAPGLVNEVAKVFFYGRSLELGSSEGCSCSQEMFRKQKGYLEEELDYRKQALDQAYMQIQELEATLYNALQHDSAVKYGEPLSDGQKDELRMAVEKLRRQMLRKSREYDCQVLQERMELLHQAYQVLHR
uniref:Janus kinase and microtubule interacting protein 2 n=1 Tax=Scleropages formosus TaxID=113540 RepID=A0A8C9QZU7_SCLFO